jgi:two-component system, LytTR family, sensor kinase
MLTPGAPQLLHVVGYLTGTALYAMLLAMVVRAQGAGDRVTVFTALFGLGWNLGEIGVLVSRSLGWPGAEHWTAAASYTALGFLAAVVVHSVARGTASTDRARSLGRLISRLAYACAGGAGLLHMYAAATGGALPSPAALALVSGGLLVLAPALLAFTGPQGLDRRALWMIALAIFAVSAVHLGRFHGANESWTTELIGHHASIPLAFAILYQDYRFGFADLFLKQALTLIALVAIVFATWSSLSPSLTTGAPTPRAIGTLLTCWVATALVFPRIRRGISTFVDRVVLARADYATLLETLASGLEPCDREDSALDFTCREVAPALSAHTISWEPADDDAARVSVHEVVVPTADAPRYMLSIGPLAGGRRLLSDDFAMLDRVALIVARRIDAIRLIEERHQRELHDREMRALATEAELRALRAQINPHFLFNALTTIGYLIQSAPPRALKTLMRLTALLRTVLRSEGEFTTLSRERELIDDYLGIERERFEERLRVVLDIPDHVREIQIPSLIVQPLVENAIKHGIAAARSGGVIAVTAALESDGKRPTLIIRVSNTGAPLTDALARAGGGLGLRNVEQRLRHYYNGEASLRLFTDPCGGGADPCGGGASAPPAVALCGGGASAPLSATVAELRLPLTSREERLPIAAKRGTW